MSGGKFIVVEGIDRSGKTTLSRNLASKLESGGRNVFLTHEPTDYLDSGLNLLDHLGRNEYMVLLAMFIRDRLRHNEIIRERVQSGDVVICDRYSLSSLAYQGVFIRDLFHNSEDFLRWIENVLSISHLNPDVTVFIDYDGSYFRQGSGEKRELEIFEEDEYLKKVYQIYRIAMSGRIFFDPGVIIDGNDSKENMLKEALSKISPYI